MRPLATRKGASLSSLQLSKAAHKGRRVTFIILLVLLPGVQDLNLREGDSLLGSFIVLLGQDPCFRRLRKQKQ